MERSSSICAHLEDGVRVVGLDGDNKRGKVPNGILADCLSRIGRLATLLLQDNDIPGLTLNQLHRQLRLGVRLPTPAALKTIMSCYADTLK